MVGSTEWRRYVDAERVYLSAVRDMLATSYGPIVRAAFEGRGHDGPRSFRTAIGVLPMLPRRWIEQNLDCLMRLALEGGPEWFALRVEFDRVASDKLNDALHAITDEITLSEETGVNEYRALLRLLKDRGNTDLIARVTARAATSSDEEIRELSDERP